MKDLTKAIKEELNKGHVPGGTRAKLFRSLEIALKRYGRYSANGGKTIGMKTTQDRRKGLTASLKVLYDTLGFKITSVTSLQPEHINALVKYWVQTGYSASTKQSYLSFLRLLGKWIGKPKLVGRTSDYFDDEDEFKREYVSTSWTSQGIDPVVKIIEVAQYDAIVAIQLLLELFFGLMQEEAMKLMPHKADMDVMVNTIWGTKGGKQRWVPMSILGFAEQQHIVLDLAKECCKHDNHSTIPRKYNFKQWRNHYNYVLKKAGITRADNNITSHGLRYEYAIFTYEKVRGLVSPLRRELNKQNVYVCDADTSAHQQVSKDPGHAKEFKTSASIGEKNASSEHYWI